MIIWINGAFGAGKTTLAAELQRRMPDAISYDPEHVGDVLTRWAPTPPSGDFQDLPLWRKLAAQFAIAPAAEYGRTLIVAMTLVNPQYRDEIFGLIGQAGHAILHVFLDVPAGAAGSAHQGVEQVPEFGRRVSGQAAVHGPRLDDRAARRGEPAEPRARRLAGWPATAALLLDGGQPGGGRRRVGTGIQGLQAFGVELDQAAQVAVLLRVEDHAGVHDLTPFDPRHHADHGVLE